MQEGLSLPFFCYSVRGAYLRTTHMTMATATETRGIISELKLLQSGKRPKNKKRGVVPTL